MATAFTDTAHIAMTEARAEASQRKHTRLGTEHLLLGLIAAGGEGVRLLTELGVDPDTACTQIEKVFPAEYGKTSPTGRAEFTSILKSVINRAQERAQLQDKDKIGTNHLLLAVLDEKDAGAAKVLISLGADMSSLALDA